MDIFSQGIPNRPNLPGLTDHSSSCSPPAQAGHASGESSLWSLSGRCLYVTSPPEPSPPVGHIAFGHGGYHLYCLPAHGAEPATRLTLARRIRPAPVQGAGQALLLGWDRVFLLRQEPGSSGGGGEAAWSQLLPPAEYCAENAPLQHVAQHSGGSYIAVAGRRGAAICALLAGGKRKWRLFGDVRQESRVLPTCLAWSMDSLVIGTAPGVSAGEPAQLLFYPNNHLDKASLQRTEPLPHPACELHTASPSPDCRAGGGGIVQLLVHLSDGSVALYQV